MARVLFIQDDYFPWLGPMYISALLKRHGHRVQAVTAFCDAQVARAVRRLKPDLVAMHAFTGGHRSRVRAAAAAKAALPGLKVILGGPHPTYFPEVVEKPPIDFVCRGEGERPMLDLVNRMDAGGPLDDIPNIWAKIGGQVAKNEVRPLLEDLDELPFPDRELYPPGRSGPRNIMYFMAGRGCPHRCSFCFNERGMELYRGKGPWVRLRSPENVLNEIEEVQDRFHNTIVRFEDDTFTLKRDWSREFLELYGSRVGLPFFVNTRADKLDREMTERLKSAGCYMVTFGIETANERMRNELLQKNISNDAIRAAAQALRASGIAFQASNMLGLPGETVEDGIETVRFNAELKVTNPFFLVFQPYPSTCMAEISKKEWGLDELNPDMIPESQHAGSLGGHIPAVRRLCNLHKFGYLAVKHPALLPLVRQLIKLPPNPAFMAVHRAGHLFAYSHGAHLPAARGFMVGMKVTFGPPLSRFLEKFRPEERPA